MKRSGCPRVFSYKRSLNRGLPTRSETVPDKALFGWMRTLVGYVRSGKPDLTNRQMALLLSVYLTPGPHTVRGLARLLGVSKPVVTRALNTLGTLGYLRRERDDADRRNVFVARTDTGTAFLEGFGHLIEGEEPRRGPRVAVG
jgi:DNA-binding HxlR family transcriptional regulator